MKYQIISSLLGFLWLALGVVGGAEEIERTVSPSGDGVILAVSASSLKKSPHPQPLSQEKNGRGEFSFVEGVPGVNEDSSLTAAWLTRTQFLTGTTSSAGLAWQSYMDSATVRALAADNETIWAATDNGIVRWDRDNNSYLAYTTDDGLVSNDVTTLALAPAGHLWVGTWGGVSEFDGQTWRRYTTADGLANNHVRAIAIDQGGGGSPGQIWFATAPDAGLGGGASTFDGLRWTSYTTKDGLISDRVLSLAIDQRGRKWFGTDAGVSLFNGQTWTSYTSADGLAHNWVNAIIVDPAGALWFGTAGGGVSRFVLAEGEGVEGGTWTTYSAADGLAGNVIHTLAIDAAGQIWAGASGGLSKFDGTGWVSYTRGNGFPYSRIQTLAIDRAGRKWLGFGQSSAGIIAFDDSQWAASPPALPTLAASPATSSSSATIQITGRRLIDDQAGRIYARGLVEGVEKTLVLAYADEHLLATYDLVGELGLDSRRGRLYADQGPAGLAVINTQTGRLDNVIFLPEGYASAPPQVDPMTGDALVVRDNVVYLIHPETVAVVDTLTSQFTQYLDCASGPVLMVPAIFKTTYDNARRVLYTASTTSICNSSASGGFGYGVEAYRLDTGARLAKGEPGWSWFLAEGWAKNAGPVVFDPKRQRFYEAAAGGLRVFDAKTMSLAMLLPQPVTGTFEHYSPGPDALQFRVDGRVVSWPAAAIQPPAPESLNQKPLPQTPVTFLAVSPTWAEDRTLFGLWVDPAQEGECRSGYLNWGEGLLFLSQDGGRQWGQSRGGLRGSCELMTSLAVSPDYGRDQTLFAGMWGLGIFKSSDGGRLWLPASAGLSNMDIGQILLSPDFGRDQTVFVKAGYEGYYRSGDGGQTWQKLAVTPEQPYPSMALAISPEFGRDKTLASVVHNASLNRAELYLSRDGGGRWILMGAMPEGVYLQSLNLAPLFAHRQILYAYGTNSQDSAKNALYRSADGGQHWQIVFSPETPTGSLATARPNISLLHAPGIPENRLIFLLANETVYESKDGGLTWQPFELAGAVKATALAISPVFGQDRLLFIGTAEGQVLRVKVAA